MGFCDERYTPTFRGFDSFTGYLSGIEDYYTHKSRGFLDLRSSNSTHAPGLFPASKTDVNGTYSTFVWRAEVGRILKYRAKETPLFVFLATQSVHSPIEPPDWAIPSKKSYPSSMKPRTSKKRRSYAGAVGMLDALVGDVETQYIDAGIWNQTILVFLSDNGAVRGDGSNFPLRGNKYTVWEGGVRSVAFVRGPRDERLVAAGFAVPSGENRTQLMHAIDWLPTLSSIAGYSLDDTKPLDGVNQWTVLTNNTPTERIVVLNSAASGDERGGAIRDPRYKLMFVSEDDWGVMPNATQDPPEGFSAHADTLCDPPQPIDGLYLFDIIEDPRECINLAASQGNEARRLTQLFDEYRKTAVEPLERRLGSSDPEADPSRSEDRTWGPYADRSDKCAWGEEWSRRRGASLDRSKSLVPAPLEGSGLMLDCLYDNPEDDCD